MAQIPTGLRTANVFVPGGLPTYTYYSRSALNLEDRVEDYLDERHKILSVSGPTKTGKTVLLKSIVRQGVWLTGGSIENIDNFWEGIVDALGGWTAEDRSRTDEEGQSSDASGAINLTLVRGDKRSGTTSKVAHQDKMSRNRQMSGLARDLLGSNIRPLVIDDFHYIPTDVQLKIVRALKDMVFDGLPVVVAAVPHRAYDVVRVEKEMTGRVEQLEVGNWSEGELKRIAETGFDVLNLYDPRGELAKDLAEEAFASPHLMQEFCLHLCKAQGFRERPENPKTLSAPDSWDAFYKARANAASKASFDILARGPRQRSDRKVRRLSTGVDTDIYGAVLAAISHTGPQIELTYETIRSSLREVVASDLPQRHEVTRVLEEMAKIARDQIEGEPVVDYDTKLSTLHISDPFFAYYLRWGAAADNAGYGL